MSTGRSILRRRDKETFRLSPVFTVVTGFHRHRFSPSPLQGYPACTCPCPTLRERHYCCPHMARGQDGSLLLSCMTLSFTTSRRFIPTHPGRRPTPQLLVPY